MNKMRNLIIPICFALCIGIGTNLTGQSVQIEDATRDGFDGLRRLNDDGYYLQFATEWTDGLKKGSAKVRIVMMDNDLMKALLLVVEPNVICRFSAITFSMVTREYINLPSPELP